MSDSIYNYRREHGRTYHAYKDGKYIFPNDDRESDRLDLQHHLFNITFDNRLYHAPVNTNTVRHCLDVGTGTGIWAMDFADQFPSCNVIGTDLSPTQPSFVPPNCSFLIDDMEDEWAFQDKFDLIHGRLLAGCLADWDNFFRQAYENLAPGGWLELQDYGLPVRSFDGTHAGTNIHLWGELLCAAAKQLGRPMGSDACDLYARKMREAGFVDVHELTYMWPSNSWPKDPKMKEIGKWNQVNCIEGLEGFCLALLTRGLGWEKLEVDIFVAKVRQDFMDRKIHTYFPMPVVFGRKPF
ncbi:S-adenosyl-L-methionine-dependent methyltransferase [Polychaeton citri CBS 116435]|uniref:S-adenosyl-L-methionine-dependent methyltransferase n=1 Tax=Polychaeton citri CBS 116435 TaxID=1314669 RepID=A0A9P4Q8L6_9PEZI|nr:S-adenosyl-L-methionine-dependent methyltransferase [Polychaeton citri CBS 116435]